MLSLIPPAGTSMVVAANNSASTDVPRHLYSSGTAALAAVLQALVRGDVRDRREVIIPSYGCPALVAAVRFAGLVPVLADVGSSSPFFSRHECARLMTEQTLAIVAVNFLGLEPENPLTQPGSDTSALRPAVIYDCCQGWPSASQCVDWAVATVVSFGRGKPVSLGAGGGVLLNRNATTFDLPDAPPMSRSPLFPLTARLYNIASHPLAYWWVDKLPFLGLGRTEYRPLTSISTMPSALQSHLSANVAAYLGGESWTVARVAAVIGLDTIGSYQLLPALQSAPMQTRLLRLPVLAESQDSRDKAVTALRRRGFGATAMYQVPLWKIAGLQSLGEHAENCRNAPLFADRLLTLPIHNRVSECDLFEMAQCLSSL